MTIGELIERLQLFDPSTEVETGYGSVDEVRRINSDRPVVKLVHFDSHTISQMRSDHLREIERLKCERQEHARKAILPWEEQ